MTTDSLGLWKINMVTQVLTPALYLKYSEVMKEIMKLNIKYTSDIKMYITQDVTLTSAPALGTPPCPSRAHWADSGLRCGCPLPSWGDGPPHLSTYNPSHLYPALALWERGWNCCGKDGAAAGAPASTASAKTCIETSRNVRAQQSNAAFEEGNWGPRWE